MEPGAVMKPLFSLVIPTYNALDALKLTLDSVRAQDYSSLEILVQDGASHDGTLEFLAGQSDINWRSERDGGVYDAMNCAIARAHGEFLMFLGAGDTLEAGALRQLAAAIGHERVQTEGPLLIYGDAWWQSQNQKRGGRFSQWRLTQQNICHQAMVFQAELFERLGLYQARYSNCADWAWNIRAWGDDEVKKIYLPLLVARYQGGGQSETSEDSAFNADVLGLVQRNFSLPVAALYTLRRRAPQGLKDRLARRAPATPLPARAGTVSVVIPTHNSGALLEQTLDSALAQTVAPLEIIVVDDGSIDDTAAWIAAHYGARVTLIAQRNGGVARARNAGWRAARGEWIAFLDHDDFWHADKLERLTALATPDIGVVVGRWNEIEGGVVARCSPIVAPSSAFGWLFGWHNPIVSMSVPLVRRACLERVGGLDARCVPADDWDLWLRLARLAKFAFDDAITTDYAIHDGQQRLDERRMFRAARRVLSRHPRALVRRPLLLWWLVWSGAFGASLPFYKRAKNGEALPPMLWRATRAHPLALLAPQWLALLARRLQSRFRR